MLLTGLKGTRDKMVCSGHLDHRVEIKEPHMWMV